MRRTTAGPAPVLTTAGPPTHRIFSPRALVARIAPATRRTISPWGFSLDTWEDMNSKTSPERPRSSGWTRMPWPPTTTPARLSAWGGGGAGPPRVAAHDGAAPPRVAPRAPGPGPPALGLQIGRGV